MMHPWLAGWGKTIEPAGLEGSASRRFFRYLATRDAAGLATPIEVRSDGDTEIVVLEVATNSPQRPACPIQRQETVGVHFGADGRPTVLALRSDFPDTVHQNWMPEGFPASLCIDDRPWQDAKATYTPAELLHRIVRWFERVGRGELQDVGQPVDPVFMGDAIDIIFPREVFETDGGDGFELLGAAHDPSNPIVIDVVKPDRIPPGLHPVGLVFVTDAVAPVRMRRMVRAPGSLGSLSDALDGMGLNLFDDIARRIVSWSRSAGGPFDRLGSRLGMLFRIPVLDGEGSTIGRVDEVAFVTAASIGELGVALGVLGYSPLSSGPRYSALVRTEPPLTEMARRFALIVGRVHRRFDRKRASELAGLGETPVRKIVLIGAGAIGSLVAECLVREGFGEKWDVVDPDYLLPHNLARHVLTEVEVGLPKATALARRLGAIRSDLTAEGHVMDVTKLATGDRVSKLLEEADFILDAAASVPVSRFLTDHASGARRASVFLNPAGTAVVLQLEDTDRSFDLRSLDAAYYGRILRTPQLSELLRVSAGTIPYAGACRAVTSRIPASRAQALAGIAAARLASACVKPEPCNAIWKMDSDGTVASHKTAVSGAERIDALGWCMMLPDDVLASVRAMRTRTLPNETGGVLFGTVDMERKRIDLVEAWEQPGDSKGTPAGFVRGTKGLRAAVEDAVAKTLDQIRYVGEWHSHPRGATVRPSLIDAEQIARTTSILDIDDCPGLMLIVGDDDFSLTVGRDSADDVPSGPV